MPRNIDCPTTEVIDFEDFIDAINTASIDTSNEEEMVEFAPYLKKLSNNKSFLANIIRSELKDYQNFQNNNSYTSQVIMLSPPNIKNNYFIRANIWPSKEDYLTQINGEDAFFYHKPHDHNFNFLTVGYLGSGYWSDYYEYVYSKVIGYPNEVVDLKFIERSNLDEGRLLLYRAHKDVHDQLPANEFSISLNVMESTLRPLITDQYAFNTKTKKIKSLLNRHNALMVMRTALVFGDENALDIVEHISKKHRLAAVRMAAIDAIALSHHNIENRMAVYESATKDETHFVSRNSEFRLFQIQGQCDD